MAERPPTLVRSLAALEPLCSAVAASYFPPRGCDRADLLQEARIGAWKALRDYRPGRGANLNSFARLCIERQVITFVKAATRHKHEPLNEAVSVDGTAGDDEDDAPRELLRSSADDPGRKLLAKERLIEALTVLRDDLTPFELRCFLAIQLDGLTYEPVAAALGADVKAVDNAAQRARRKLDAACDTGCDVCGIPLDLGRRCNRCEAEITFAQQFLAA